MAAAGALAWLSAAARLDQEAMAAGSSFSIPEMRLSGPEPMLNGCDKHWNA